MSDLALVRMPSGRYDFLVSNGDVVRTGSPIPSGVRADAVAINDGDPAILRLLLQGEWIGDNGERAGEALPAVKLINVGTRDQVQQIVERRLASLITAGKLTAVTVLDVQTADGQVLAKISVTRPGQQPYPVQVRLQ